MQVAVNALIAMQYVQSVDPHFCPPRDGTNVSDLEEVSLALCDLLLKVLLPHVPNPAANMTKVYRVGLPVMFKSFYEGPRVGGELGDLLEGLLDRMVTQQDLDVVTVSGDILPALLEMTGVMFKDYGEESTSAHLYMYNIVCLRAAISMLGVTLCAFKAAETLRCCKDSLLSLLMFTTEHNAIEPVSLQVVYTLLDDEGIMGCMRSGIGEYLDSLQEHLTSLLKSMHGSGELEHAHNLLAAACLVKTWDEGWGPEWSDNPCEGERMVAWCLRLILDAQVSTITHYRVHCHGICICNAIRSSSFIHCQQPTSTCCVSVQGSSNNYQVCVTALSS